MMTRSIFNSLFFAIALALSLYTVVTLIELKFAVSDSPAPMISLSVPAASPMGAPVAIASPDLAPVAVPAVAAPPAWAQDVMTFALKLPLVGPFLAKALLYMGILSALLTSLVGFLLAAITTLSQILNFAGLGVMAQKLTDFKNGWFMYYLKYFSNFNAKFPQPPQG